MHRADANQLVLQELDKAEEKFGAFNSAHEGYAVLKSRVDGLWDAIKLDEDDVMLLEEAKQVAAMAIRFIVDLVPGEEDETPSR